MSFKENFGQWTEVGNHLRPRKDLQTLSEVLLNGTVYIPGQDVYSHLDEYSLKDRDGMVISIPNILCERCRKICLHSRLLNDPTLWFNPAKAGEEPGSTHSGILNESWGHHLSFNDVKVTSLQGCHLCTLFLSTLQKERPKHVENAILSEASMALLKK